MNTIFRLINKKKLFANMGFGLVLMVMIFSQISPLVTFAQLTDIPADSEDPTNENFRIILCDGPDLSGLKPNDAATDKIIAALTKNLNGREYIPCNFNGFMMQVQHALNLFVILGVLVAVGLFTWAGIMYMTGVPGNIDKAKGVFVKVFWGFVIMLIAWFIVYQLIDWLTPDNTFTKLLGNP